MSGRHYWVSGASSGIGASVARVLLVSGHRVTGLSRRQSPWLDALPDAARARYRSATIDLGDLDPLPARIDALLARQGIPDGAILCAGRGDFGSLEQFSPERIRGLIDLNLTAVVLLLRSILPAMKRAHGGDIVLIGSEAALNAGRRGALYCATKFGLRGLALALRQECARAGVRVGLINPGMVDTPFFDGLDFAPGDGDDEHLVADDVAQHVVHMLTTRRGALVDELNLSPLKTVIRKKGPRTAYMRHAEGQRADSNDAPDTNTNTDTDLDRRS